MYVTAQQVRDAFSNLSDTTDFPTATLEGYIAEFERIAAGYRGVTFEKVTESETRRIRVPTDELRLRHREVRSVTSVAVDGTTLSSSSYDVDLEHGVVIYRAGFRLDSQVVVVYEHGLGYRVVTDGVTTSSDATLTSATAAFTSDDVGLPISGTGIPNGARISSVTNTTTIELTANATASGTGLTVSIVDPLLARACKEYVRSVAFQARSSVARDVIAQSVEGLTTRFSTPDITAGRPTGYLEVDRMLNALPDRRVMVG